MPLTFYDFFFLFKPLTNVLFREKNWNPIFFFLDFCAVYNFWINSTRLTSGFCTPKANLWFIFVFPNVHNLCPSTYFCVQSFTLCHNACIPVPQFPLPTYAFCSKHFGLKVYISFFHRREISRPECAVKIARSYHSFTHACYSQRSQHGCFATGFQMLSRCNFSIFLLLLYVKISQRIDLEHLKFWNFNAILESYHFLANFFLHNFPGPVYCLDPGFAN